MAKVLHFKKDCIGCGACVAIAPDFWEMDEEGFAQLKNSVQVEDHFELEISSEEDKAMMQEAVDVCPVGIIKLVKK